MDETVTIGYTSYWIWSARWSNRLGEGPLLDSKPDAYFLIVEMSVRNNDKENRSIPPFTLLDEKGAVYSASGKGWALEGSIGVLDDLNPGVRKRGTVVFDVPKAHRYRLRVSGGYWSGEEALIDIVPN